MFGNGDTAAARGSERGRALASRGLVAVTYRGRLGNNLAQYCFARIVADQLGFALDAAPLAGFPATGPRGQLRSGNPSALPVQVLPAINRIDLSAIVANRAPRLIASQGYFLRYEYFQPWKSEIRDQWLRSQTAIASVDDDIDDDGHPDDLTIHIRAGDIWRRPGVGPVHPEYPALPYSFYARIIEERPWRRITVVSEDGDDPMVRKLARDHGAKVQTAGPLEDFACLRGSTNIVLSISTFAWWAAWLSRAVRIYYPEAGFFDARRACRRPFTWQQDLWVHDERRYRRVPIDPAPGDWQGEPADRLRLLEA